MIRTALLTITAAALGACASGAGQKARAPVAAPTYAVQHLLDPCWPADASAEQRVELTLLRDGAAIKDVIFETRGGASNSVGRCLRQVLWLYPWRGDVPQQLELAPPARPPNGWAVLEHIRLLTADLHGPERGVIDPLPLVQACLAHGSGVRPGIGFYVTTAPVRVHALDGGGRPTDVVTDSERCLQAVLASTVYPGARPYRFDFSRGGTATAPAERDAVAHYFEPPAVEEATGEVDQGHARAALSGIAPAVGACWESALGRRGGVAGGRTFRIRVEPSGRIAFAQVVGNRSDGATDAVDYLLDRCVADAVRAASVPPPEGGAGEFAYSWVFATRQ